MPPAERKLAVRALTHPVAAAFGLANLYLLALTGPLFGSGHALIYHLTGSASVIFIPVLVYLLVLWVLLTVILVAIQRTERLRRAVWAAAILVLPWSLLKTCAGFFEFDVPHWVRFLIWLTALILFVLIVARQGAVRRAFDAALPLLSTILGVFALCGVAIFAELLWFGWQSRDLNPSPPLHRAEADPGPPRHRIIWIVLDELSYQQVYEQRFPGLALPAFDRLAAQSTVFTNVVPDGKYTRQVMPSLFTGIPVDGISVSGAGLLTRLHDPAIGKWKAFDPHQTVFEDALDRGYSTGIAGWYNPYCRMMPQVLDHCYWTYGEDTPAYLSPDGSATSNLTLPFHRIALTLRHRFNRGTGPPTEEQLDIHMHADDYRDLLNEGDTFLKDPSITFLLLHMPVPHPIGFYNRRTGTVALKHTSYIDNLALADQYLGHVEALLERDGQWDKDTVVVMGDHSWRTSLIWDHSAGWTPEDRAASHGGQFDPRPAYIVKLPNQHTGERIDGRYLALRTRAMFDAMLDGRLETPAQLRQWVLGKL